MNRDEFWTIVEKGVDSLPDEFSKVFDNVEIMVKDYPDKETRAKMAPNGLLLGLYMGVPITKRGVGYSGGFYSMTSPDRIFLYQKNIEAYCKMTRKPIINQIKETLFHEIGHYMGLNEGEVSHLKYKHMK